MKNSRPNYNWQFYLLLAFTIIYTATLVPAFKITLEEVSIEQILFFDYLIVFLIFFFVLIFQNKTNLILQNFKNINSFLLLSLFGLIITRVFYLASFSFIQATEANILYYTYPLVISILGFFVLGERIRPSDILGAILAFLGAFIVVSKLDFSFLSLNIIGDGLAILGGACWAVYLVLSKKFNLDSLFIIFYTSLIAALVFGFYLIFFSSISIPSFTGILGLLYIGITEGVLFYLFINLLRKNETSKIANTFYVIPFVVAVLNYFILNEIIYPSYIIGLILLTIGLFIQNKDK